jgi:hypothetical protein
MVMTRFEYKGLMIQSNCNPDKPQVKVFRNSCFLYPLFVTTSLDLAMRWTDDYDDYNRDLALRARNGQVGSGMRLR